MKDEQHIHKLPEDWLWTTIGQIAILSSGGTPDRSIQSYFNGNIPWIKSGELNYDTINTSEEKITLAGLENSSAKIFPSGTLLIALYGSTVGKLAFLGINAATNQAVASLITTKSFEKKYLYYYLISNREKLLQKRIGGAQPNISQKILQAFPVPLAPLELQKLIVFQLDVFFSRLQEAEVVLKKAEKKLKIYRKALLKDAFRGKLTNVCEVDDELPPSWKTIKISDISDVVRGGSPRPAGDPKFYGGEIPFLKVKDLTKDDNVHLHTYEYTIKDAGLKKTRKIEPRTLLLSNSGATLGIPKVCMINATINDGIAAFLNLDDRTIYYLYYFLLFNTEKLRDINMGAAQPNLNTTIIKNINLPYCSFEEQNQIVEILESRLTLVDNLERLISKVSQEITVLQHSILKRAFEGKLITEQTDESAVDLLSTILEEKISYLDSQIEMNRNKPKQEKQMDGKKSILQILKESDTPISVQNLWENSSSDGDIESFYNEIKNIYSQIVEVKSETESLLSIKNEDQ